MLFENPNKFGFHISVLLEPLPGFLFQEKDIVCVIRDLSVAYFALNAHLKPSSLLKLLFSSSLEINSYLVSL